MVGERGYPMEVLSHYAVGYCTWADPGWDPSQPNRVRLAQGRVIIPIYDSGMLVGWQARYIETRQVRRFLSTLRARVSSAGNYSTTVSV